MSSVGVLFPRNFSFINEHEKLLLQSRGFKKAKQFAFLNTLLLPCDVKTINPFGSEGIYSLVSSVGVEPTTLTG